MPGLSLPDDAFDAHRMQFRSVDIMKALGRVAPADTMRILGLTEADLSIPMLSFLFGQAQFDGPVALVSLCRLRQEFYSLPGDDTVLRERLSKEILHELGHTFGLTHCADSQCAMSLSTHVALVDAKRERYCAGCGLQLAQRFGSKNGDSK
jgi:archaemetzincin